MTGGKFLFIFLLLLKFNLLFAQVPGYKGRRVYFSYNLSIFPLKGLFFSSNENWVNSKGNRRDLTLNLKHEIEGSYVVSVKNVIGFSVGAFQSGLKFDDAIYRTTGKSLKFSFQVFSFKTKGAIAPYGYYNKLALGLLNYSVEKISGSYPKPENSFGLILSYGIGKQFVVWERLVGRVGLQFAYPFIFSEKDDDVNLMMRKRIKSFYLMNLDLGLGVLF